MLTITSVLALFTLLALATGVFFVAKRLNLPYTVLLVLVGLLLVPIVKLPYLESVFGFLDDLTLTPELLFYIFLPILIFESGFNMNIRKMLDSAWSISLLAIVGLLVSTLLIAFGLWAVLPFVGIEIPFILALLFGAVISATDPVAVLALFKEYGAPRRLTMIFEGESLFNDGTAVALFMVILAVAVNGFHGAGTVIEGVGMFAGMVVFGIILGLVMAALFSRAVRFTRSNEFATVTLLIISAHFVFILGELINEHGLFGWHIHISSIIATTVTSLFLGNYARHTLSPKTDQYLSKFIEHMAFIANSLVFILAGLLFASSQVDIRTLWLPILVTVLVVAAVRVVSVYTVVAPLNSLKIEEKIPQSWQLLLSWGSLRGALAIIIILLIPEDFAVEGWAYPYSPRDFLLALTIGCILATLFIKAPLIKPIMRKLSLDKPEPLSEAEEADLGIYYLLTEQERFSSHKTRGFVDDGSYEALHKVLTQKIDSARIERNAIAKEHGSKLFEQSLHLMAIHVEKFTLRQLYINGEISERMYRKIYGKLNVQTEKIEYARHEEIDPSVYIDRKDVFDHLVNFMQTSLDGKKREPSIEEKLQYYRAQMIIARKAVKALSTMQHAYDEPVFYEKAYEHIIGRYEHYRSQNADKVDALLAKHPDELAEYLSYLAKKSIAASGNRAVAYLHDQGITNEEIEEAISHKWSRFGS